MAIKIGNISVNSVAIGSILVDSVAIGSNVVWEKASPVAGPWLCFTANTANSTIRLDKAGFSGADPISLETSTDGTTWTDYNWTDKTGDTLTMTNIGDKVYFRAKNENTTLGASFARYYTFKGTGSFAASGNIQSLLKADCSRTDAPTYCYSMLFNGCSSLTDAPELPATTLADNCYSYMFNGCSSLSSITVGFSDWQSVSTTYNWLSGVAASGEFYCPDELSVIRGVSNIPTNWEVNPAAGPWLCFTAEEANSTVAMAANGSAPSVSLEYSTDGSTWSPFVVGTTTVTLANIGDKVYVRATSAGNTGMGTSTSKFNKFVMTGKIAASGNVDTLLDQNGNPTLTNNCYNGMFQGCTSLTTAPALPATTLASSCYSSMFDGCTSLTTAPELPATTLASSCYFRMFYNCTSLTTAPALPATTLASYCYNNMFRGCTSLMTAPALPATTLADNCYRSMFNGCTNLNSIKLGYTGNFGDAPADAFNNWVQGVASTGTFYYNGSDTTRGVSAIPSGWTITPFS